MIKIKRKKTAFLYIMLSVTAIIVVLLNLPSKPPTEKINLALKTLSEARKNKAHIYDPKLFFEADKLYKLAMSQWRHQNDKFFLNRNFFLSEMCSTSSIYFANIASKRASTKSKNLKLSLKIGLKELKEEFGRFGPFFSKLPIPDKIRKEYSHATLFLSEAEIAYKKNEFIGCQNKLNKASNCFIMSYEFSDSILADYFINLNDWQNLTAKAITKSKRNRTYVLIVDKFSHQCSLYYKGNLIKTYLVELGRNWIGDKLCAGDKATPEGEYKIIAKKAGSVTKYHKALLINYPNDDDYQRFKSNIKKGVLAKSDQIGGSIEIHGGGGKGVDWTDGCVALTNSEIDHLYRIVPTGTTILIVGSLKTLNTYYNF